jgi:hypothetical protein
MGKRVDAIKTQVNQKKEAKSEVGEKEKKESRELWDD